MPAKTYRAVSWNSTKLHLPLPKRKCYISLPSSYYRVGVFGGLGGGRGSGENQNLRRSITGARLSSGQDTAKLSFLGKVLLFICVFKRIKMYELLHWVDQKVFCDHYNESYIVFPTRWE